MKRRYRHRLAITFIAAILLTLSHGDLFSETTRTIKIVVPFPPGGGADILARLLAEQISHAQGTTMLVENRPGAASVVGTEAVSHAAPDGNTLLTPANSFVINPILKKLNYDPLTNFEPICYLVRSPQIIAVNSASPYQTLADLLLAARAKPGELTLASVGPATAQHIAFELLKRAAKVNINFVPYSGNAPAVNALLGGHVTSVLVNYPEVAEHVNVGKLRALATASRTRIEQLPNVPTIIESGYKDYEAETWLGLVAPAGTSKEIVAQLASWFTAAMKVPPVEARLVALGLYPVGICGKEFATYLRTQYDDYARVIRESNIKTQ
jgi:tripartite-type tricarboxylate transporter receptor subunit TctC